MKSSFGANFLVEHEASTSRHQPHTLNTHLPPEDSLSGKLSSISNVILFSFFFFCHGWSNA